MSGQENGISAERDDRREPGAALAGYGRRLSLAAQVAICIGIAGMIPLLFLTALAINTSSGNAEQALSRELRLKADAQAALAEQYLEDHSRVMDQLASTLSVMHGKPLEIQQAKLDDIRSRFHALLTLQFADAQGNIMVSSPAAATGAADNIAGRAYFRVPMQTGESYVSDAFVGQGYDREVIVAASAPVRGAGDAILGVVEGSLTLAGLVTPGGNAEESGGVVILDREQRVLWSHGGAGMAALRDVGEDPAVRELLSAQPGTALRLNTRLGSAEPEDRLLVSSQMRGGWTVIAWSPAETADRQVRENQQKALMMLMAGIVLTLLVAWIIGRLVASPLLELSESVRGVSPGHWQVRPLSSLAAREFAALHQSLDDMAVRLAESDQQQRAALEHAEALRRRLEEVIDERESTIRERTEQLRERGRDLEQMNQALQRLAVEDPLTEIANRRAFDAHIRSWIQQGSLAMISFDADAFKAYNDHLGHAAGDLCLQKIVQSVRPLLDSGCLFARVGGEEFAILRRDATRDFILDLAERVRQAVQAMAMPHPTLDGGRVTISVGVAISVEPGALSSDQLMVAADGALYAAKRAGRNLVRVADEGWASVPSRRA